MVRPQDCATFRELSSKPLTDSGADWMFLDWHELACEACSRWKKERQEKKPKPTVQPSIGGS